MSNDQPIRTPKQERDRIRKKAERALSNKHGLKFARLSVTRAELAALKIKAGREGWEEVFSDASRRKKARDGNWQDLTSAFERELMLSRRKKSTKVASDADVSSTSAAVMMSIGSKAGNTMGQAQQVNAIKQVARRDEAVVDLPGQTFFWDPQSMVGGNRSEGAGENGVIVTLFNGSNQ